MTLSCHAESTAAADTAKGPCRSAADIDGPCISVTGVDGERVYCSMQASASERDHSLRSQCYGGQLTKDSMQILMELVSIKTYALYLLTNCNTSCFLTCQSNAHNKNWQDRGNLSVAESEDLCDLAR